jgi:hypothetical protein
MPAPSPLDRVVLLARPAPALPAEAAARARSLALQRLRAERLALRAPDAALASAVEGAMVELERAATVTARGALAALATGGAALAAEAIRALGGRQQGDGFIPAETPGADATPLYLLLAARYLAWTGDFSLIRQQWARILPATARAPGAEAEGADRALWGAALKELVFAAEGLGDKGAAARLGEAGKRLEGGEEELALALPEELAEAAAQDPAGTLAAIAGTLLGAEPDAPKHRLRLRPRIPEGWAWLEVERLRIGDGEVSLRYRREGDRHTFTLEQESGAVPVTAIFEPLLPARHLASATVDGQPATLDPRPLGERLLVPVQVVLDYPRTVELDAPPGAPRIRLPMR